jgi:replication factor C subunit 3/5
MKKIQKKQQDIEDNEKILKQRIFYEKYCNINKNNFENDIDGLCFNKDILNNLKIISEDEELPNIIFYGKEGTGKKTIINMYLEMIYNKTIYNLRNKMYLINGSGGKQNEIYIKESDFHIVIDPNNNNFDRYMIPEIVKEYAKKHPLYIFDDVRTFKIVQINKLDNLSYYAQTSLRRTIEKYSKTCRFIFWCHSLSKISEPLRSRCLCLHVPVQKPEKLLEWSNKICKFENVNIEKDILLEIIERSNGSFIKILCMLNLYHVKGEIDNSYDKSIIILLDIVKNKCNIKLMREEIYNIMKDFDGFKIIKDITIKILTSIDDVFKQEKIINLLSDYEYKLSKARRKIIHIEAYFINIYNILK